MDSPVVKKVTISEFEYDELSYNPFEIRLITFESAHQQEELISLKLSKESISSSITYYALSYTWGRPSEDFPKNWDDSDCTKRIMVNGKSIQIRMNLYTALLRLREVTVRNSRWWIDAICLYLIRPRTESLRNLRF